MKNTNPHIPTLLIDGDNDTLTDTYDIIVHWGLLYHLKEIDSHLEMISKHCSILFLETEVADSDDQHFFIQTDESGYDQAFNSKGIRPSAPYVERILSRNGFQFKRIEDPILNWDFHMYDWPLKNTGTWNHGLRRFWICWKDTVPSPLLPGRE
jgi:hypothetical protein